MLGFIGLGVMGEPICRNLAKKSDEKVLAFDLKPGAARAAQGHGVEAAESVQEVAERCHMVFLSLPGVAAGEDGVPGPGSLMLHMRSGGYVVDLSTTTVALARDLHSRFTARGIHFADAPVARTRAAAEKGTLLGDGRQHRARCSSASGRGSRTSPPTSRTAARPAPARRSS